MTDKNIPKQGDWYETLGPLKIESLAGTFQLEHNNRCLLSHIPTKHHPLELCNIPR